MKKIIVRLNMPETFKEEIICLVNAINNEQPERITYWKKIVDRNIDEALGIDIISAEEAKKLKEYYELEEIYAI